MDFSKPDAVQPYFYKDEKHAEYVCSWCGLVLERSIIKTLTPSENRQKPDNSDYKYKSKKWGAGDPIYNQLYGQRELEKIDKLLEAWNWKRDIVTDEKSYIQRSEKDKQDKWNITTLPNVTLQYCTSGESFYGHPIIRMDPEHPKKKEFYCQICAKAHEGEPYADKHCWHYIKIKDIRQRGYNEQAILTAIAANPGKSISDIAKFCQANFKGGNFSYGNVYNKIMDYLSRGKVCVFEGGHKNNKVVY